MLGQLRPIDTPRSSERQVTQANDTSKQVVSQVQRTIVRQNNVVEDNKHANYENSIESNDSNEITRAHVTQLRHDTDIRSSTVTPEPVHNQESLTQEIVWIPEKPIARRGSYTIDKSDGNGYSEYYQNSEVVPVENGVIRNAEQEERSGRCSEERSNEVIRKEGFEQNIDRNVKHATAQEKKQAATEEVRTNTDVQQLANGGISKTTTTTTVRKVGTSAKTANATSSVTRTATVVTSRDIGVK